MNAYPSTLAVIPARGGSKGIPRKNVRMLCGKPLIQWSLEASRESALLDRMVVSTEDPEIAGLVRQLGVEVLDRPRALATDEASTLSVLKHVVQELMADIIVVVQPTSPIRSMGLIDGCIRHYLSVKADSLGTVHKDYSYEYGQQMPRRQEIRPRLVDNGNVYVIASEVIRKGKLFGDHLATYEISRPESVEIDDEFDFWLAEKILESGLTALERSGLFAAGDKQC